MVPEEKRIRVLSDHVANKIAAGEVVDRPASVLKELMENALDAGATQLDVEILAGGRKLVAVSDNGHGMNRDDALLCIERHATSKIREVEDIDAISTLGFRGEALAAISSVSRFTLATRRAEDEVGTEMLVSGGKVEDLHDAGCPVGTSIKVQQLFFNVPARRRFMRTEQTESSYTRQTFLLYALAEPAVGMRLTMDGREVYRLSPGSTLRDRILELFGPETVKALRPVDYAMHGVRISGFTALPHLTRNDKSDQHLFINGRPAAAALLSFAVQEGYQSVVPRGRYPMVFIFVHIDPAAIDVNVHPTKKEVRFRQPIMVRDATIEAIREALARPAAGAEPAPATDPGSAPAPAPPAAHIVHIQDLPELKSFSYPRIPMTPADRGGAPVAPGTAAETGEDATARAPWAQCRVLGQVGGLYVVLETDEGLVLMDPHAAHERILYERFMKQVLEHEARGQGLLVPETLEFSARDAEVLRKNMDLLTAMGFGISEFGGDTFMVDALPTCLGNVSAKSVITDVAAGLERGGGHGGTERWAEKAVAQSACKAAVKARDKLSVQEVEQLVVDLAGAQMPYTCPHGRPTVIFMSYGELDRKFGRA